MTKFLSVFSGVLLFVSSLQAQEMCGTDFIYAQQLQANPELQLQRDALEQLIVEQMEQGTQARDGETIVIPTAVHVMYSNCEGNISKAQVEDGIRILNDGFNLRLPDTAEVRDEFQGVMDGMNIEFRLARIDPDGQPTDGINRRQTSAALNFNDNYKSIERWPSNRYYNIWVVENIDLNLAGQVNGYAQFPTGNWNLYGVVIRNDKFGTIGTSNADGSTMTHETGHTFNLFHTFQDGCGGTCSNSGDRVCDTPPAAAPDWSCSSITNTCTNDAGSGSPFSFGTPDMMENFMSYSSCRYVFTEGQADRMTAALNISTLAQLRDEDNLIATGVAGFQMADFRAGQEVVYADQEVQLFDATLYEADAWEWDFGPSSFPPTSTAQNPAVTFITSGLVPVTLKVFSGIDSLEITKEIMVAPEHGRAIPFTDSFENDSEMLLANWQFINTDLNDVTWEVTNTAGYSSTQSLKLNYFGLCGAPSDALVSTSLDLEPFESATLSFRVAFAKREAANNDFLRLWLSRDQGETWDLAWVRGGNALRSVETFEPSAWTPADTSEWRALQVNISNSYLRKGTLAKLEFVGDGGNNFFIDDIAITGVFKERVYLKSPANGALGLPEDVLLDWKAVGDVDYYEYQIAEDFAFTSASMISGTKDYISTSPENEDTEFLAEALPLDQKLYWRVRYNKDGVLSEWSDVWNFRISNNPLGERSIKEATELVLYPNPTNGMLTVTSRFALVSLQLIDLSGRVSTLNTACQSASTLEIDMSGMAKGAYILRAESEEGELRFERVILQ